MASTRARDNREPVERLLHRVLCVPGFEGLIRDVDLRTHATDPARIGVDHSAADLDAGLQSKFLRRLLAEAANDFAGGGPQAVLNTHPSASCKP